MSKPWIAAACVVAVIAVGAAAVMAVGGDDSAGGEKVRLEPVDSATPDPFMDENLDVGLTGGQSVSVAPENPPELDGTSATGSTPGLYGGSMNAAVCDVDKLVGFLTDPANADKATAWAAVHGLGLEELADYIAGLTPVRLRVDTRITNHSFVDGQATPFQSVLQAGTAVLVDDQGVPRTKCYCGNPLVGPAPSDAEPVAQNPDDAWEGYDPASAVTVDPGEQMDGLTLGDLASGEHFQRPIGSKGDQDQPGGEASAPPAEADDGSGSSEGQDSDATDPGNDSSGGGDAARCILTMPDGSQIEVSEDNVDEALAEGAVDAQC